MYHMRTVQLILKSFALMLILLLGGCSVIASKTAAAGIEHTNSVSTPLQGFHTIHQVKIVGYPLRLLIPSIQVNALVEPVGVSSDSDLATPAKGPWTDVGWYSNGPMPGEQGSAVIDGHLDRPGGYPAVFWNLRSLAAGDKVSVVDAAGKTYHFHVTAVAFYQPQDAPLQEIFGNNAGSFLNLITCAGDWIPSQHQTTLRLVVYTTLD